MLLPCPPSEIEALLPGALTGEFTLAPVGPGETCEHLDADDPLLAAEGDRHVALVVSTSGSTGRPKGVALSTSALLASAAATRERWGDLDWVSALPGQYVAGLMTLVRALEAGTRARRCAPNLSDLPYPDRPTAVSLVPTQLQRALDEPDRVSRLAAHTVVLLGGAAATPGLVERARSLGVPVITSYGMSETCGGCVHDGTPLPGVEVVADPVDGRLSIRGPVLFEGYLGDPAATGLALSGGWFLTADRGEVLSTPEGPRVRVLGRVDDVVVSGGVNVDLAHVQRRVDELAKHPAAVVGAPHPEWGTAVVLVVEHGGPDLAWWKGRLAEAGLGRAALPKALVVRDTLPRLASGKIDRQGLAAVVAPLFAT